LRTVSRRRRRACEERERAGKKRRRPHTHAQSGKGMERARGEDAWLVAEERAAEYMYYSKRRGSTYNKRRERAEAGPCETGPSLICVEQQPTVRSYSYIVLSSSLE
jgi:hypothetical protein